MIRVLIVDDHFTARIGLSVPINGETDMKVIAEASTGMEAITLYRKHQPDIVIMDYRLPDMPGVEALESIRADFPTVRALMLTVYDGEEDIYRAINAGAQGYLTKSAERIELLNALRLVAGGASYFPPGIIAKFQARESREPLTERELAILRLIVSGSSNKDIVAALHMSMGTIKLHVSIILDKMGASDRTQAATLAIERGIIRLGE
jgi:DNA-binding NarL/FixJ family response regulator